MRSVLVGVSLLVLSAALCSAGAVEPPRPSPSPDGARKGEPPRPSPSPDGAKKAEPERRVDGKSMVLIGSGVRDKSGDKLYSIAFFVGDKEAKRSFPALVMRAGGRDKAKLLRGDHAPAFLIWGHFPKLAVLKFARAVPAAELRADLATALDSSVKGADDFLAAVEDAQAGDEWLLTTLEDGEVTFTIHGEPRPGPAGPKVARAIWSIWLGEHPLSTELRRALIEHVDVLGAK